MVDKAPSGQGFQMHRTEVVSRVRLMAIVLILVDFALILTNVLHFLAARSDRTGIVFDLLNWQYWSGRPDGSVIELFGHLQLLIAVAVLLGLWRATERSIYFVWGVILLAIVADDFFMLHERSGYLMEARAAGVGLFGLGPGDIGQLLFWLLAASVLGAWLVLIHIKSNVLGRRDSRVLATCVVVLIIFAVGVDMLHAMVDTMITPAASNALNLVETAGEILAMTLILLATLAIRAENSIHTQNRDGHPG